MNNVNSLFAPSVTSCPSQSATCPFVAQVLARERLAQVALFRQRSEALAAAADALEAGMEGARQQVGFTGGRLLVWRTGMRGNRCSQS